MSKSLTLEIPGDVADALRLPDAEKVQRLRVELSVALYSQGILGLGKASQLAHLPRTEMHHLLSERKIPLNYGPEELAEDLQHGRGGQWLVANEKMVVVTGPLGNGGAPWRRFDIAERHGIYSKY